MTALRERMEDMTPEHFGDDWPEWEAFSPDLARVIEAGTVEALRLSREVRGELAHLLNRDEFRKVATFGYNAKGTAIRDDLCRAGSFERYDPSAIVARNYSPKVRIVDGVKYEV